MQSFAKLNEPRLYKLLKTCMDSQTDLKGLVKATVRPYLAIPTSANLILQHDFEKRLDQSSSGITSTMSLFLRRASFRLINQSSIPSLLKRIHKAQSGPHSEAQIVASHAQTLLAFISKHSPSLYKLHISELCKGLTDEKNLATVEVCLQALSAVAHLDEELAPNESYVSLYDT